MCLLLLDVMFCNNELFVCIVDCVHAVVQITHQPQYKPHTVGLTLKVPPTGHPPAIKATYRQCINSHESAAGESVVA